MVMPKEPKQRPDMEVISFQSIQKDVMNRRISAILNFKGFNKQQKALLLKFYGHLQRKGLRLASQKSYLQQLKLLMLAIKKPLTKLERKDIDLYLLELNKKYKPKTITERRKFLILFLEWLLGKPKEKIDLINDLDVVIDRDTKLPEELLTPEEIKRMVQVASSIRDKCLIMLLYETASRKGEFLQLKVKHIEITNQEYAMVTIPKGKTTSRKLPLIFSLPYLQNWLSSHPQRQSKDFKDAPLFVTEGSYLGKALGADGLKRRLKVLAKRSKISKKVFPHLFRHSRLTELGKELTEAELCKYAGWVGGSSMSRVYVHLSGSDVSNKLLANAGLIDRRDVDNGKSLLNYVKCPRCDHLNASEKIYCDKCSLILDIKEANKLVDKKQSPEQEKLIYDFIFELSKIPKIKNEMGKIIEKLGIVNEMNKE